MAHTSSQRKRIRQDKKRNELNSSFKSSMRTAIKKAQSSTEENSVENLNFAFKKIDKAAAKGLIHKNTAARKKSKLAKAYSKTK
jgi:small subunit ribosomal protein S20